MSAPLIRQTKVARVIECIDAKDPNGDLEKLLFDDDLSVLERNECMYALLPYIGVTGRLDLLKRFTVTQDIKSRDQYGSAFCTMLSHVCRFGHMNMLAYIHEIVGLSPLDLLMNAEYIVMNDQLKVLKYFIYICNINSGMIYNDYIPQYAMQYGRINFLQFMLEVGPVNMSVDDRCWVIDVKDILGMCKLPVETIEAMRWLADNYKVYRDQVDIAFNRAALLSSGSINEKHYQFKNTTCKDIALYILGRRPSLVRDSTECWQHSIISHLVEWRVLLFSAVAVAVLYNSRRR